MSRPVVCVSLAVSVLGACGGGGKEPLEETPTLVERPSGAGVCALLMQPEVDELFGVSVGSGANESLEDGSQICVWPAGEDPALLLQVSPAASSVAAAVDLGEGYRVHEVSGMSGPAALAVELPGTDEGAKEATIAVLAITTSTRTVTISPVGLGIGEHSPRFERLKNLIEAIVKRL